MANKPGKNNWNEIQMAITAIAITSTLGFWNMFSTPDQAQAAAKVIETSAPPPPDVPTEAAAATLQPTATTISLRPVKIIFGDNATQLNVVQVSAAPSVAGAPVVSSAPVVSAKKKKGGGGGGGGGGAPAPQPPPSTGSSKPKP